MHQVVGSLADAANGQHNIRINAVCPGAIHTPMMDRSLEGHPDPQSVIDATGKAVPLRRFQDQTFL